MGCYDRILVPCPKCGTKAEFQTKSGACAMRTYELSETPADVLIDVNRHAPATCDQCGTMFRVESEDGKPTPIAVEPPPRDWPQETRDALATAKATQERCDEWREKAEKWQAAYWALVKAMSH